MSSFTPYISFPGTADEAFHYYQEIFGGHLEIGHYGEVPTEGFPFDPPEEAVTHAQLSGGLVTLAGGDGIAAPGQTLAPLDTDVYSLLLTLDTVAEAETIIDRIAGSGGTVRMPFALAPWGDHYGQVADRFGVRWDVTVQGHRS